MQEFILINKNRDRIKIFKPFEDNSKPSPTIDAMEIQYTCVYKRSSKPVIKGSRVESIFPYFWMRSLEDIRQGR